MDSAETPSTNGAAPLLACEGLCVRYAPRGPFAVEGVSLAIGEGECLGLVGGSGCGKSTVARALVGLEPAAAGRVLWRGRDIASMDAAARRECRRAVQLVFQDSLGSLDPRMRAGDAIGEALLVHRRDAYPTRAARRERARELLARVELPPELADRFPHELSGGQRQRVAIARALAVEPRVLLADEPVSALDVAVQAQLLRTLRRLLDDTGLAMLFVSHDLAVVRCLCPRAVVMDRGRVVEEGPTAELFARPRAAFTRRLLDAVPRLRVPEAAAPAAEAAGAGRRA